MYLYKFKLYVLKSKQENEFGSPETKLIYFNVNPKKKPD